MGLFENFHMDPFISIAVLLAAALVGGMIAHRLRQPIILGYLLIGVLVGPYALALVEDLEIVEAAASIGVALLMFTLGLEISISQLREVGRVGVWGGITQITATLVLGIAAGCLVFRWPVAQAVVFGLIISLSSTAVCLKLLMERGELSSMQGRIMVSILIVQDLAVVLMIVIMPFLAGSTANIPLELGIAAVKAAVFIGLAIVLGRWILPWLMGQIGGVRARELFLLTVLVLCLGAAVGTQIFGLSMVFGAFLVGLVLRETRFVHQALAEITPLRDIFATLFFVSLGMLLDPKFVLENWAAVLGVVGVIMGIKLLVIFFTIRVFGYSNRISVLTAAGLFQIGEFGFILAQAGMDGGTVSHDFYSLILASAIITILLTPLSMSLANTMYARLAGRHAAPAITGRETAAVPDNPAAEPPNRVVIVGYGRVGQNVARGLQDAGIPHIIVDIDPERVAEARADGRPRIYGDGTNSHVLSKTGLDKATALVITYPDPMAVITTAKIARELNPKLIILARVHRIREARELQDMGITEIISPEYEASFRFIKRLLNIMNLDSPERKRILRLIRRDKGIA